MASNLNERCDLATVEILREARRLVDAGWCQGATAKDAGGRKVDPHSPEAVLFDPFGAIERAVLNLFQGDSRYLDRNYYKGFYAIATGLHTHSAIAEWNDDPVRRIEDILASFDRTIEQSSIPPVPHTPKVAA